MRLIGQALEAAGQALQRAGSRLREPPALRQPKRLSVEPGGLLASLQASRQEVAQRLAPDGWRTLDRSMVQILRRLAVDEPDAQQLAEFLVDCTGMQALDLLSGQVGQGAEKESEGKRKSLECLVLATLEASRQPGQQAFEASALEVTVDLWLLDPSMAAAPGQAMDVLRQFSQTIRETASSDTQAEITRLGLALCTSSVIHLWRYIEALPSFAQELCGWTAPGPGPNAFELSETARP